VTNKKVKINMVGGGFQHDICSQALNTNKHVEWDKTNHEANISIHIDSGMHNIPVDPSKINFGWVAEASVIIPQTIILITNNLNFFKQRFKFIFTYDPTLLNLDPDFFKYVQPPVVSWVRNKHIYKKNKLISFIGSNKVLCEGHKFRQQMINKYENLVDHFGRGFPGRELPFTIELDKKSDMEFKTESGKILGLKDYMFSIVMENAIYDNYYTEKIADCFATGTIPIYWGTRTINQHFDSDGIVFLEDIKDLSEINEELYNRKLKYVENNLEILKNTSTSEDFLYFNYFRKEICN